MNTSLYTLVLEIQYHNLSHLGKNFYQKRVTFYERRTAVPC